MDAAALRGCEWDEVVASWDHGPSVRYVYRRAAGARRFEPWVVVARSALLGRLGRVGLGLYAARGFREGAYVGRYDGALVGHFASREAALASGRARRRLRRGHDKLVTARAAGAAGVQLLDGDGGGAPYVQLANDPRGTRLTANAELTDFGYLRVTHARVPAFDLDRTPEENARSELRWAYGDDYWRHHEALGRSRERAIECD